MILPTHEMTFVHCEFYGNGTSLISLH